MLEMKRLAAAVMQEKGQWLELPLPERAARCDVDGRLGKPNRHRRRLKKKYEATVAGY